MSGRCNELGAIGRPVIFVDIQVFRRQQLHRAGCDVHGGETLLVEVFTHDTDLRRRRRERARGTNRTLRVENRNPLPIRRPPWRGDEPIQVGQSRGDASLAHHVQLQLAGLFAIGQKSERGAVR